MTNEQEYETSPDNLRKLSSCADMGSNFIADKVKIRKLLIWVRFLVRSVEYYTKTWLERVGNRIEKTLRVDDTTMVVLRGKFASICVEIDLSKPLRGRHRLRVRKWKL